MKRRFKRDREYTLVYLLPGLILMTVFVTIPFLFSVTMSFNEVSSVSSEWKFVGFDNYVRVFQSPRMISAFGRTILYGASNLLISTVLGLVLAFFVAKHRLLGFYRYIFYLPGIVSTITMGRLWNYMLTPTDYGFVNAFFMKLGWITEPINFLGDDSVLTKTIVLMNFYGAGGGMMLVLYTTAINNVDSALIESAKIEGASPAVVAFKIQLPLIKPIIVTNILLGVIGSFKSFEGMYALAPNADATETIAVFLYKESIGSSHGYGQPAATGMILTIIVMAIMTVYMLLPKREED